MSESMLRIQWANKKHAHGECYVAVHRGLKEGALKFNDIGAISDPIPSKVAYEILGEHAAYLALVPEQPQAEQAPAAPAPQAAPAKAAAPQAAPAKAAAPQKAQARVVDKLAEQPQG